MSLLGASIRNAGKMGDEEKPIMLNGHALKLKPELEFVHSVSSIISSSNTVELAGADEDICLCILERTAFDKKQRFGFSRLGGHITISLRSCTVDDRFFSFITRNCQDIDVKVYFSGDCRTKIGKSSSVRETAELLTRCEQIWMTLRSFIELDTPTSEGDFWFDLEIGGKRKDSPELASCIQTPTKDIRETNYHYVPFISVKRIDNELQITDVPLMMPIVHLPFFEQLCFQFPYKPKSGQGDFTLKTFDEIRKRSATLQPCAFENHYMTDYSHITYILDHFNETKLVNLWIPIHKDCTEEFLTRVLDVVVQSVYLRSLKVSLSSWLQYDLCLFFTRGLRKIAARMMPFFFTMDCPEQGQPPHYELYYRKDEVMRIFWRNDKHYHIFLIMASVRTLGSARVGPACLLQMLPIELLRLLHSFLISFNDQ